MKARKKGKIGGKEGKKEGRKKGRRREGRKKGRNTRNRISELPNNFELRKKIENCGLRGLKSSADTHKQEFK